MQPGRDERTGTGRKAAARTAWVDGQHRASGEERHMRTKQQAGRMTAPEERGQVKTETHA